jgi:hypothetical protein
MPKRRTLNLTPEQQQELVQCRDHHGLPYMRERTAGCFPEKGFISVKLCAVNDGTGWEK